MQVVMMESEVYQNLIDRLERIEKYVIRATERKAALDDEDVWLDNEQVCQLLDVSARSLQRYRSEGKLPYQDVRQEMSLQTVRCGEVFRNPLQGYWRDCGRRGGSSLHAKSQ